MFKKDSLLTGIIIGVVVTVGGYALLHFLNIGASRYFFDKAPVFKESIIQVISIFLNVFPFRYYMLTAEKDYTGRGILMVTFIVGMAYFFYYLK